MISIIKDVIAFSQDRVLPNAKYLKEKMKHWRPGVSPKFINLKHPELSEADIQTVLDELVANNEVVVVGGRYMLPGFYEKIQKELSDG